MLKFKSAVDSLDFMREYHEKISDWRPNFYKYTLLCKIKNIAYTGIRTAHLRLQNHFVLPTGLYEMFKNESR